MLAPACIKALFNPLTLSVEFISTTPVSQADKTTNSVPFKFKPDNFKDVTIPLILQNELVSTQTDLNPNDSNFEKYKKIFVIIVFVLFLILYIIKRNRILLILTIISFITAIMYNLPNSKGVVKKDSYVYILPTKNSTIFFKVENNQNVEILQRKNGFIKVLGNDSNFIGWIKEESFGTD